MSQLKLKELKEIPKVRDGKHWNGNAGSLTPCPHVHTLCPHTMVQKWVTHGNREKQELQVAGQQEEGHSWRQPGTAEQ